MLVEKKDDVTLLRYVTLLASTSTLPNLLLPPFLRK